MPELTGYIHLCKPCEGTGYAPLFFYLISDWKCPTCKGTGIWEASQ